VPVVLTSAPPVAPAQAGEDVGTRLAAPRKRASTPLMWLAYAARTHGRLVLDDGAVTAVVERGKSLLPAGVTAVQGEFEAGDPVEIAAPDGTVVARGLVAYSSQEAPDLLGRSTSELRADLGEGYDRELVHRDDLVLVRRRR
jgi:glutamate 5-kinase